MEITSGEGQLQAAVLNWDVPNWEYQESRLGTLMVLALLPLTL